MNQPTIDHLHKIKHKNIARFKFLPRFLIMVTILLSIAGCKNMEDIKTTVAVEDNGRHYYPILTGQELEIVFPIKNTGMHPFMLTDIITSCGCITANTSSVKAIPAGAEGRLLLKYNSTKNIGYVKHYITLYGNLATADKIDITFDVHVVPNAMYTKDYEELYQEEKNKGGNVKDLVDGNENNKGYYMDEDF